jgi:hypothetical protein
MHRWIKTGLFALAAALAPQAAHAQVVVSTPGHVVLPSTSYYSPVTVYSPPATVYSPPPVTYYSPPPVTYYSSPVTVYSAPVATYVSPYTVYSAPAAYVSPGVVTTRTYAGFGVFRPRGVYTESYVAPVAPRAALYRPLYGYYGY